MIDIKLYNNIKSRMSPNEFGSCSICPVYIAEEFGVFIPNSKRCYKKIKSLYSQDLEIKKYQKAHIILLVVIIMKVCFVQSFSVGFTT